MVGLDGITSIAYFACGHKGLALLDFLSDKGCQAAYVIDNKVDVCFNDFDMYLM